MSKKFMSICFTSILLLFGGFSVTAQEETDSEEVLNNYLNAMVDQNVEKILEIVNDERYNDQEIKQVYIKALAEEENLLSYTILEKNRDNYIVELSFDDGLVTHMEIEILNNKVLISEDNVQIPQNLDQTSPVEGLSEFQTMSLYPPTLATFVISNQAANTTRVTSTYSGLREFGIFVSSFSTSATNNRYVRVNLRKVRTAFPDVLLNTATANGQIYISASTGFTTSDRVYAQFEFPSNTGSRTYSTSGTVHGR
ncbi:hypothetical protein AB3N04_00125 (plasmid) [Alkalihalophilus sp. As8PL]|uniref:PepSY domain-containing protein n=1 Tax=Alkalihalophilus sp. As8PL TaxID=3237103 RepID=A0AB39BN49_9BACI